MQNRTRFLAAAALAAATLTVTVQANAEDPQADHSPCFANREANSMPFGTTREEVERRAEVTGKGVYAVVPGLGWGVVAYPWCGHQFHNHSPLPYEYIGAVYSGQGKLRALVWVKASAYGTPPVPEVDPPTVEPTAPPVPCTAAKCPGPLY